MQEATLKCLPQVDGLVEAFEEALGNGNGSFGEREQAALRLANEVVRRWAERDLRKAAARFGDEVMVDGQRYRRHASGTRKYHSLCGPLEVPRATYRLVGVHNGPTVVPLELEAGISANATPALVASAVQAFAMMPLRHYEDEMQAAHRCIPARSTLERICKRVGSSLRTAHLIEHVVRSGEPIPEGTRSVSVGLDRTTIPMAEPQSNTRPRKTASHVRSRPPPLSVAYRMAYVGTIALHDSKGGTLQHIRVTATADEGSDEVMGRLCVELLRILSRHPSLSVIVVQDGAPELWNLVNEWFGHYGVTPAMELIDRYHVEERLAQTAEAIEPDKTAARRLLERWRALLDRSDRGMSRIRMEICQRLYAPSHEIWTPAKRKRARAYWSKAGFPEFGRMEPDPFDYRTKLLGAEATRVAEANLGYFDRRSSAFHYATARRRGFPIGSGVTEGACKSVIAARFKRSGQRWFETGASPCLHVRTMHLNNRLRSSLQLRIDMRRDALRCS